MYRAKSEKAFRNALEIINEYGELNELIELRLNDAKEANDIKKLKEYNEKIKKLNESFKNQKFDDLTKMKYKRFRKDYQTKRDSILRDKQKLLKDLKNKFDADILKINSMTDEEKRDELEYDIKNKYYGDRLKIKTKYKKIMDEFTSDFRYRIAVVGLKWSYIIYDELNIS